MKTVETGYVANHSTGVITTINIVETELSYYACAVDGDSDNHLDKTERILNTERFRFEGMQHFHNRLKIEILEEFKTVFLRGKTKQTTK